VCFTFLISFRNSERGGQTAQSNINLACMITVPENAIRTLVDIKLQTWLFTCRFSGWCLHCNLRSPKWYNGSSYWWINKTESIQLCDNNPSWELLDALPV